MLCVITRARSDPGCGLELTCQQNVALCPTVGRFHIEFVNTCAGVTFCYTVYTVCSGDVCVGPVLSHAVARSADTTLAADMTMSLGPVDYHGGPLSVPCTYYTITHSVNLRYQCKLFKVV